MSEQKIKTDDDLCECDRPDERDNPHRHVFDMACVYWIAGRPSPDAMQAAAEGRLPLTGGATNMSEQKTLAHEIRGAIDEALAFDAVADKPVRLDSGDWVAAATAATDAAHAVVAARLRSMPVVDAMAQALTEHEYSNTAIGRCHCGRTTGNMPRHRAQVVLAAVREELGLDDG